MKRAVQYGAGNIGRGFIGQIMSQSGYEVFFIDVNQQLVEQMNRDRAYPLQFVSDCGNEEVIISNVRAVSGLNLEMVADEISQADLMATAVGVNILPRIARPIALGLKKRWQNKNWVPLDIIICENLINANLYLAELIRKELDEIEKIYQEKYIGFVEASIGRMVPVMTPEMQSGNILRVCVEKYAVLPVDKDGFKGPIPDLINLIPYSPFEFYIQRKLFIHNMGHAVTAYLGARKGYKYIWEAIEDVEIENVVQGAMIEAAEALSIEKKTDLASLQEHVYDLIKRFGNHQLGDTIERVGRDLARKLAPNDRILGAIELCLKNHIKPDFIYQGFVAALHFEDPTLVIPDEISISELQNYILKEICLLADDSKIRLQILEVQSRDDNKL